MTDDELERIFILSATDRHLEVLKLDSGEVCIHAPALVSRTDAEQISIGIQAILSGQFDRACSEETLLFDIARRTRASSRRESAPTPQPNLGDL